jgi:7-cyano-7-deazaguanine synthase
MSLLLLSGGTDSTCLAYALRPSVCLTVDYGQKIAQAEIEASSNICKRLRLKHEVVKIDLRAFATGSMAGQKQKHLGALPEWWPFRNQLILTIGSMVAHKRGLQEVIIGTVRSDRRHRDGSVTFLRQMDRVVRGQEGAIRLLAPAGKLSAEELFAIAEPPLSLLGLTFSCHRSNFPCGQCGGCRKNEAVVSFAIGAKRQQALFGKTMRQKLAHALKI